MHGRVKVKTTAEQQEEKRKERLKKLHLFQGGLKKAFEKRSAGEYDEEALSVTGQLLQANPDVYTLWNFRKEIYLHLMKVRTEDELQELASDELLLTEQCLRSNPKSYGAWHHRSWIMLKMPKPDWDTELQLCTKFLQLDERNFHCWDYRRFVCQSSKVEPLKELEFSLKKIEANFSNYSSWHYRSSLLPVVYPQPTNIHCVAEDKIAEEYELVKNAVFTDPGDQSAWFYHRWLLGRAKTPLSVVLACISREYSRVAVVLNGAIKVGTQNDLIKICINESPVKSAWLPPTSEDFSSCVWYHHLPIEQEEHMKVTISLGDRDQLVVGCASSMEKYKSFTWGNLNRCEIFRAEFAGVPVSVLENELQSCQELQELEPDNKWVIFSIISLMRAIGKEEHETTVLDLLDKLADLDPMRTTYYKDLRSKFLLEDMIGKMSGDEREISLTSKHLTRLCHMEYFIHVRKLDLSMNKLWNLSPLKVLLFAEEIILDDNEIRDCNGIRDLPCLEVLSMRNNYIKNASELLILETCSRLKSLYISGNPLCSHAGYEEEIKSLLSHLTTLQ